MRGNFKNDFFADALMQLCLTCQTGQLKVTNGVETILLMLNEGRLIYAMGSRKELRLGKLLQSKGILDGEQLNTALGLSKARGESLGKVMIDEGYVAKDLLATIIRKQAETILVNLLSWNVGGFEFEAGALDLSGIVANELEVVPVMLDVARKVDDPPAWQRAFADRQIVPAPADQPLPDDVLLEPMETKLYAMINGKRTVAQTITEFEHDEDVALRQLFILRCCGAIVMQPPAEPDEADITEADKLKKRILRSIVDLPPMPRVVQKAQQIMSSATSSFQQISKVLETDPAIAARVLKMANSAYYGLSGQVSSIQHAAVVLGFETLGQLITVAGTSSLLGAALKGYQLDSGDLWRHSLAVAFASKIIAGRKSAKDENDAFSAGLIHDAGKIILDKHLKKQQEAFAAKLQSNGKPLYTIEKEILGFDHAQIASELCNQWKIPEMQAQAIRFHHAPTESNENRLAYTLHVADMIARNAGISAGAGPIGQIAPEVLTFLNLEEDDIETITAEVVESVAKIAEDVK